MKITNSEYRRRRRKLMDLMEPNSIAIIPSARQQLRSRDTEFHFRQDSDFYYLSGFQEPESVLVLIPGREHGEYVMFCPERDPQAELWHGQRAGPDGLCSRFGADDAFPIGDIDDILPGLIEGRERVYYSMGRSSRFDQHIMDWVNTIRSKESSGAVPPGEFTDLDHMLHDLRLIKSAAEQRIMRRAGEITAAAHRRIMQFCQPGQYEYELEGELHHEFVRGGARYPAYLSIVGSGRNACTLHYVDNSAKMRDGDLVLVDAGCELESYAADVSRTFPVGGTFSPEQRALYEVVLAGHAAAIAQVRAGNHFNQSHDASVLAITEGLVQLGLLEGEVDALIESQAYRAFYMHKVGHWLGLDVHDVGDYRVGEEWRVLEPGMVMTIEPGIYVAPDNTAVAKKWRGIGIRIEDNVLVTTDGCDILTDAVPRTVDDIEALMAA
ncbi:Xaa-Pro aminopeptidase [Halioglobus japonicus]|uniref:Xaa-Pro aminopeptidase n=1 Tax=Halioglobus japonicus TaxID=930805 RepID=A0AAP8SMJ5_9GAMM|nr:Xaa-Pro aminopeptidase [Halioglobus japonicus]AQA17523.1 Xaa-Pro aminopeptidase [Halioglobus japonicus]PLW85456.1 Xaa-Pro aminopeptidase [Halioglobus japonicus]GHD15739.1 Xaa-Pro aminopeptidase [Halioglobus japonicus]